MFAFQAGEIEDIIDQSGEAFGFDHDDAEVLGMLCQRGSAFIVHEFGEHANGGERGF